MEPARVRACEQAAGHPLEVAESPTPAEGQSEKVRRTIRCTRQAPRVNGAVKMPSLECSDSPCRICAAIRLFVAVRTRTLAVGQILGTVWVHEKLECQGAWFCWVRWLGSSPLLAPCVLSPAFAKDHRPLKTQ